MMHAKDPSFDDSYTVSAFKKEDVARFTVIGTITRTPLVKRYRCCPEPTASSLNLELSQRNALESPPRIDFLVLSATSVEVISQLFNSTYLVTSSCASLGLLMVTCGYEMGVNLTATFLVDSSSSLWLLWCIHNIHSFKRVIARKLSDFDLTPCLGWWSSRSIVNRAHPFEGVC